MFIVRAGLKEFFSSRGAQCVFSKAKYFAPPELLCFGESSSINIWSLRDQRPREPVKSITQLILKEETSDLNGRSSFHRWTNIQRANQTAFAIDARVDTADGFTA